MRNLKGVDFLFYLRRSIFGSPLAIPSKTENLAHPHTQTQKTVDARFRPPERERVGKPRTPTSANPGMRRVGAAERGPSILDSIVLASSRKISCQG